MNASVNTFLFLPFSYRFVTYNMYWKGKTIVKLHQRILKKVKISKIKKFGTDKNYLLIYSYK